jgi:cytochrome c biogenesis factor
MTTSEVGLLHRFLGDLYIVLGEKLDTGADHSFQILHQPLIYLIWIGVLCISIGGLIGLGQR